MSQHDDASCLRMFGRINELVTESVTASTVADDKSVICVLVN